VGSREKVVSLVNECVDVDSAISGSGGHADVPKSAVLHKRLDKTLKSIWLHRQETSTQKFNFGVERNGTTRGCPGYGAQFSIEIDAYVFFAGSFQHRGSYYSCLVDRDYVRISMNSKLKQLYFSQLPLCIWLSFLIVTKEFQQPKKAISLFPYIAETEKRYRNRILFDQPFVSAR